MWLILDDDCEHRLLNLDQVIAFQIYDKVLYALMSANEVQQRMIPVYKGPDAAGWLRALLQNGLEAIKISLP